MIEDISFLTNSLSPSDIGYISLLIELELLNEIILDVSLILRIDLISNVGYSSENSGVLSKVKIMTL